MNRDSVLHLSDVQPVVDGRAEVVRRVHAILSTSSIEDDLSGATAERIVEELERMVAR